MSSLFSQAKKCLVGGVNSPVRSFQAVGGEPIFIKSAKGAYLTDSDNLVTWNSLICISNHYISPNIIEKCFFSSLTLIICVIFEISTILYSLLYLHQYFDNITNQYRTRQAYLLALNVREVPRIVITSKTYRDYIISKFIITFFEKKHKFFYYGIK